MSLIVYHGGIDIIEKPLADVGRENLDFGKGFYVTDIKEQALDWARRVANRKRQDAVLNQYTLDKDLVLANYRCMIFDDYDAKWLDFIVACRTGETIWQEYDYVEGGVANDRVIDSINLYMANLMTREKVLEELSKHRPNNQICIINQEIIEKHLVYNGNETVC